MGDPLGNVTPGQPIPTRSETWNAILAAARADRKRRAGGGAGGAPPLDLTPAVTVLVRNDTGGTLLWPGVLALGESVISAVDRPHEVQARPLFAGTAPAAATDAFALMTEPLKDTKIGVGVVAGIAVCEVAVSDEAHGFAVPIAGNVLRLASATAGPARILDVEEGTGNKRAVVLLDQGGGGGSAADPEACGWLIGLAPTNCLLSTVVAVYGRCSGIDTEQFQRLEWDAGESKFKSGDDATDTPEDDFTYDGPAIGPIRFWMVGVVPHASIDAVEGIKVGCGDGYVDFAFSGALCTGTTTDPCGKNYFVVRFTCSCCTATEGWTGSGWYCVEDEGAANGKSCRRLLVDPCDDTVILSGPHADAATCEAACCEIAGWGGAGWYCVFDGTDCEAVELLIGDKCDDTITICSGPYVNEAAAIAGCGVVCCPDGTVLTFSLVGITNTADGDTSACVCPSFDRSYSVTLGSGLGNSSSTGGATCDGNTTTFAHAECSAGDVLLTFFTGVDPRATYTTTRVAWNCNGANVMTLAPESVPLCTGFPGTITVTATPP